MSASSGRRTAIKKLVMSGIAVGLFPTLSEAEILSLEAAPKKLKGNINHSVCYWCYSKIPLEEFCAAAKALGISAVDLVGPKDWETLKKYDLDSSMCNGAEINLVKGWNDPQYHETLIRNYTEMIPLVAKAGYKNLICFSGNRDGMDDETGLQNSVTGLKKVLSLAEKHGVVLTMELLNSRIDHKDYMCDRSVWGIELCKRLGSENFRLLYDIYHMQIDEGDVIRSIQNNHTYYGHYHTAGNPGRHELDENQELNYPAIMKAIHATGFKGYVAQEFIPAKSDKIASLKQAIALCDI